MSYYESMNSILIQELMRYNTLISRIRETLKTLVASLQGLIVITADIEKMVESLRNN